MDMAGLHGEKFSGESREIVLFFGRWSLARVSLLGPRRGQNAVSSIGTGCPFPCHLAPSRPAPLANVIKKKQKQKKKHNKRELGPKRQVATVNRPTIRIPILSRRRRCRLENVNRVKTQLGPKPVSELRGEAGEEHRDIGVDTNPKPKLKPRAPGLASASSEYIYALGAATGSLIKYRCICHYSAIRL